MTMCEVYCILIFSFFFFGFRPKEITDWYGERTGGNNTKKKKKNRKTKLESLETASPQHFS